MSIALGHAACLKGHSVLFTTAVDIINTLSPPGGSSEFPRYLKPPVLIVDELGYLPIESTAQTCCDAAPGVDGLTWRYEADLDRNLTDLHSRVQRGAYRALSSRRTYIPKADGKQRPLAVAALEDKIAQRATADSRDGDQSFQVMVITDSS